MTTKENDTNQVTPTELIEGFDRKYPLEEIVRRLENDRERAVERFGSMGREDGSRWAAEFAEYQELTLLENAPERIGVHDLLRTLTTVICGISLDVEAMKVINSSPVLSRAFAKGFIEGALDVWESVKAKLGT